jgi:hypothetical protein
MHLLPTISGEIAMPYCGQGARKRSAKWFLHIRLPEFCSQQDTTPPRPTGGSPGAATAKRAAAASTKPRAALF